MGLYRATIDLRYSVGGTHGTNTFSLRTVDVNTASEVVGLMTIIKSFYQAEATHLPVDYTCTWDGTVRELGSADPALITTDAGWVVPGTQNTGGYAPAPVMGCITWRTAKATRSGRGRTFIGPLWAGCMQTDGTLTDDTVAQMRANAAALVESSDNDDAEGAICIWSEKNQTALDVTGSSVTDQCAVLRSRRD